MYSLNHVGDPVIHSSIPGLASLCHAVARIQCESLEVLLLGGIDIRCRDQQIEYYRDANSALHTHCDDGSL